MASKHREEKTIAAVACPTCRAPRGQPCHDRDGQPRDDGHGRLQVCTERRAAWRAVRDGAVEGV